MDTDSAGAGQELDAADDIDASSYFSLNVVNNGVTIRISDAVQSPLAKCNLFTISNVHGWAVWATVTGFAIAQLADLRERYLSAPQRTIIDAVPARVVELGAGGVTFLHFAHSDNVLLATGPALQGAIAIWQFTALIDGSNLDPLHIFPSPSQSPMTDILPNPDGRPELVALLGGDGHLYMINLTTRTIVATFGEGLTAACWSAKGKQIVCGDQSGTLTQYTPEGSPAQAWPPPLSQNGHTPLDIRWLENLVFFVTYIDPANPLVTDPYILIRERKESAVQYQQILDPLMVESPDRQESRRNVWMRSWAPFKHLLLIANSTSNTISHIGQAPQQEGEQKEVWAQVKNDLYTTLPLDTFPTGLELDLTANAVFSGVDGAAESPMPILWSSASNGTLSAWTVVNKRGGRYSGMKSLAVATASSSIVGASAWSSMQSSMSDLGNISSGPAPAFALTTGAKPSLSSQPSFGASASFGKSSTFAPAFGQSAFGQGGSAPAFGKSAFGKPAFGASNSLNPAASPFGKSVATGGFASFGKAGEKSGFASPSDSIDSPFVSRANSPSTAPAFASVVPAAFTTSTFGSGSSTSSQSPFAAAATPTSPFAVPKGGTPKIEPPKGMSGAAAANPSSFSSMISSNKLAFGSSPFQHQTSPESSTPFGQSTSAFGSTSTSSPFGAASSVLASSGANFGAFGSTSNMSVFGGVRGDGDGSIGAIKPGKGVPGLDDDDDNQSAPPDALTATSGSQDLPSFGGFGFGTPAKAATQSESLVSTKVLPFSSGFAAPSVFAKPDAGASTQAAREMPNPSLSLGGSGAPRAHGSTADSAFGQPAKFGQSAFTSVSPATLGKTDVAASSVFAGFATTTNAGASTSPFGRSGASSPFRSVTTSTPDAPRSGKPTDSKPLSFAVGQANEVLYTRPADSDSTSGLNGANPADEDGDGASGHSSADSSQVESSTGESAIVDKPESAQSQPAATDSTESREDPDQPQALSDSSQEDSSEKGDSQIEASQLDDSESDASQAGEDQLDESHSDEQLHEGDLATTATKVRSLQSADHNVQPPAPGSIDKTASFSSEVDETAKDASPLPDLMSASVAGSNISNHSGIASPAPLPLSNRPENALHDRLVTSAPRGANGSSPEGAQPAKAVGISLPRSVTASSKVPYTPNLAEAFDAAEVPDTKGPKVTKVKESDSANVQASPSSIGKSTPNSSNGKSEGLPKPFGLANFQKTTPRTSSPLASMSFAPPASPIKSDATARPALSATQSASPFTASTHQPQQKSVQPITPMQRTTSAPSAPQILAPQQQTPISRPAITLRAPSALGESPQASEAEEKPMPRMTASPRRERGARSRAQQGEIGLFYDTQEQMDELKICTHNCIDYFTSVRGARLLPVGAMLDDGEPYSPLDTPAGQWGLGDLPRLREIAEMLQEGAADVQHIAHSSEAESQRLQTATLQLRAKAEEISRYLQSRDDPALARLVETRQLSPEQQSNQLRIRSSLQAVEMALETAESAVARLKQTLSDHKLNRRPMQPPTLDSIYRTSRNIQTALTAKRAELDNLQLRIEMLSMNLSERPDNIGTGKTVKPGISAEITSSVETLPDANNGPGTSAEEIDRKVQQILDREVFGQTFRETFLATHQQPLFSIHHPS